MWPDELTVRHHDGGDHAVLAVCGGLSSATSTLTVGPAVRKQLLDRGRVVVDLSGATVQWAPAIGLFPTVLAGAGGWPLARLVLAAPDAATDAVLRASRVHLTVPIARDLEQARAQLEVRPPRVARSHEVPCAPMGAALARSFVASMCDDWYLDDAVRDAATVVATELVGNAVEHARTTCVLLLSLDRARLQIAVRDRGPGADTIPRPGTAVTHGYGLMIVGGLSRGWGVTAHDTGKTVWAVLDAETGTGA